MPMYCLNQHEPPVGYGSHLLKTLRKTEQIIDFFISHLLQKNKIILGYKVGTKQFSE